MFFIVYQSNNKNMSWYYQEQKKDKENFDGKKPFNPLQIILISKSTYSIAPQRTHPVREKL